MVVTVCFSLSDQMPMEHYLNRFTSNISQTVQNLEAALASTSSCFLSLESSEK